MVPPHDHRGVTIAMAFIRGHRILVTGGAGFLGRAVCKALLEYEPTEILAPRSREYDLRDGDTIRQLFAQARPEIVIHLAAVVGGIDANRRNPGRFFYDNA